MNGYSIERQARTTSGTVDCTGNGYEERLNVRDRIIACCLSQVLADRHKLSPVFLPMAGYSRGKNSDVGIGTTAPQRLFCGANAGPIKLRDKRAEPPLFDSNQRVDPRGSTVRVVVISDTHRLHNRIEDLPEGTYCFMPKIS